VARLMATLAMSNEKQGCRGAAEKNVTKKPAKWLGKSRLASLGRPR
jgi:hypothetical protein